VTAPAIDRAVRIAARAGVELEADLRVPAGAAGLVVFAHGSGSSRFSPRNRSVAGTLEAAGFATLLLDLLTAPEAAADRLTGEHRFHVAMLADRVVAAIDWARDQPAAPGAIALFGASTGAAAALVAAAERPDAVRAVISRGGRPDLAGPALGRVRAPALLIVGGHDTEIVDLNRRTVAGMRSEVRLEVVPGAGHLFEEPGALEAVSRLAVGWCRRHLGTMGTSISGSR
jgi:pimeloyl-ACP methyl ester carboxylesterase